MINGSAGFSFLDAKFAKFAACNRLLVNGIFLLDIALGRQPVVIEPHRIKDIIPLHPLITDDKLGLRIRHCVADMQVRRGDIGWRRIYRIDRLFRGCVEIVDSLFGPR